MKFDDIAQSIQDSENKYEAARGIRTLMVACIYRADTYAFFSALKSDNTETLFFARKGARSESWIWFCPGAQEIEGFARFCQLYHRRNRLNESRRKTP